MESQANSKTLLFVLSLPIEIVSDVNAFIRLEKELPFNQHHLPSSIEGERRATFHLKCSLNQKTMIIIYLSIGKDRFNSPPIQLNEFEYQFIFNPTFHLPKSLQLSHSTLKQQKDKMKDCIKLNYSSASEKAIEMLNNDYANYTNLLLSHYEKEEYIKGLAEECNNPKAFIEMLSKFSLAGYQTILPLTNSALYNELITKLASLLMTSKDQAEVSIQLKAVYLLALLHFKCEDSRSHLIAQLNSILLNESNQKTNDDFLLLSQFELLESPMPSEMDRAQCDNFLSSLSCGKQLIELMEKHSIVLKAIYKVDTLPIDKLVQCPLNDVLFFVDIIWMMNSYLRRFDREEEECPSFIEFPFSSFIKYIQHSGVNGKRAEVIVLFKLLIDHVKASDYEQSLLIEAQLGLMLERDDKEGESLNRNLSVDLSLRKMISSPILTTVEAKVMTPKGNKKTLFFSSRTPNEIESTLSKSGSEEQFEAFPHFIDFDSMNQMREALKTLSSSHNEYSEDEAFNLQQASVLNLDQLALDSDLIELLLSIDFSSIFISSFKAFISTLSLTVNELTSFSLLLKVSSLSTHRTLLPLIISRLLTVLQHSSLIDQSTLNECLLSLTAVCNSQEEVDALIDQIAPILNRAQMILLFDALSSQSASAELQDAIESKCASYLKAEAASLSINDLCTLMLKTSLQCSFILDSIDDKVIHPEMFFTIEGEANLQLLKELCKNSFFSNNTRYQRSRFFESTAKILNHIEEDIENERLSYIQLKYIHCFAYLLEERLSIVCFNQETRAKRMFQQIDRKIKEITKHLENIEHVLTFNRTFFKNKTALIKELDQLRRSMPLLLFNELYTFENKLKEVEKCTERAIFFNKLYSIEFYASMINLTDQTLAEETYPEKKLEIFNKLKDMISDFYKLNMPLFCKMIHLISSPSHFTEAMGRVRTHFGLTAVSAEVENKLLFILRKGFLSVNIQGILFFFKEMKGICSAFTESLEEIHKQVSSLMKSEDLNKLIQGMSVKDIDFPITKNRAIRLMLLFSKRADTIRLFNSAKPELAENISEFIENSGEFYIDLVSLASVIVLFALTTRMNKVNTQDELKMLSELGEECKDVNYAEVFNHFLIARNHGKQLKELLYVIGKYSFEKEHIAKTLLIADFALNDASEERMKGDNNHVCFELMQRTYRNLLLHSSKPIFEVKNSATFKVEAFIQMITLVNDYAQLIREVKKKGYPFEVKQFIRLNYPNVFIASDKKSLYSKPLMDEVTLLNVVNTFMTEEVIQAYVSYPFLRFFYGEQLFQLYNINKDEDTDAIGHLLLEYFALRKYQSLPSLPLIKADQPRTTKQAFELIDSLLQATLTKLNLDTFKLYQKAIISNNEISGIYIQYAGANDIYKEVLMLYSHLTGSLPTPHTILLCSQATEVEELVAFLYRSLRFNFHALFAVVNLDSLQYRLQFKMVKLINELFDPSMKSALVIFYSNKSSSTIHQLLFNNKVKQLMIAYANTSFEKVPNVEVVYAEEPGLGKTRKIQAEAAKHKENYIYLALEGANSPEELFFSFSSVQYSPSTVLHLELFNTTESLMNDVLFQVSVLKCYRTSKRLIYIGDSTKIKVELPCEENLLSRYPVLSLFTQCKVNKVPYPMLIAENILDSSCQIALNYLQLHYDEMSDSVDLYWPSSSIEQQSYDKQEAVQIKAERGTKPLDFFFSHKQQNYYQTNIELDILARQLKAMTDCKKFSLSALRSLSISNGRSTLIEALIRTSKNVIKREIKPSEISLLVFFNNDNETLIVIRSGANNTSAELYTDLVQLANAMNSKADRKTIHIIEHKSLHNWNEDYEDQLQTILTVNLRKTIRQSIIKKDASLWFNASLFNLMMLIYIRVKANVPVVLIGEAGSGRSELIQKLFKSNEVKLIIHPLHQCTTNEDIISFMHEEVLVYDKEEVVVYFKNLNRCNCVGLLSEIITKRSFQGETLRKGITFIASCLFHRRIASVKAKILMLKDKKKQIHQLVYNVNPIPLCLLHFEVNLDIEYQSNLQFLIEKHIVSMFNRQFEEQYPNQSKPPSFRAELQLSTLKAIEYAHELLLKIEPSFFSIRDIKRFVELFHWFVKHQHQSNHSRRTISFRVLDQTPQAEVLFTNAVMLSMYICFYLKLNTKEERLSLETTVKRIFKKHNFNDIVKKEQAAFAEELSIPEGIAINEAVRQNLFVLYVGIETGMPVFLIGKSGSSKSLSVNIIIEGLKAKESYFKDCTANVYVHRYQGSPSSRYEDIEEVLLNATKMASSELISIVYFDDMGAAYLSKDFKRSLDLSFNGIQPMKKVAFLATSRWILDSSILSQGLVVCIPQQGGDELFSTTTQIASSYSIQLRNLVEKDISKLMVAYLNYLSYQNELLNYEDFHGIRD